MSVAVGSRWKCAVCSAEVVVVKAPGEGGELCCGGAAMLSKSAEPSAEAAAGHDNGGETLLGKRYGHPDAGLEVLCTRGGTGGLSYNGDPLEMVASKRLPSSD